MRPYMIRAGLFAALLVALPFSPVRPGGFVARAAEEQPAAVSVNIDNFVFTPKEITVAKGTTVTWFNHDDVPHTVANPDKRFKSKALDTDDKFSLTFTDSGTYAYFCSIHPMMTGKVIVK
jgi:plastocyanin